MNFLSKRITRIFALLVAATLSAGSIGAMSLSASAAPGDGWATDGNDWSNAFRSKAIDPVTALSKSDASSWNGNTQNTNVFLGDLNLTTDSFPLAIDVVYEYAINVDHPKWTQHMRFGTPTLPVLGDWTLSTPLACETPSSTDASTGILSIKCMTSMTLPAPYGSIYNNGTTDYYSLETPTMNVPTQVSPNGLNWLNSGNGGAYGVGLSVVIPANPVTPSILPADRNHVAQLGQPFTIDLATLAAGCAMSDSTACAPNGIAFSGTPAGASIGATSFTWTPTAVGIVPFSFTLTDSVTGATSIVTTQNIDVFSMPSIIATPKNFEVAIDEVLTVDLAALSAGCSVTDASVCSPDAIEYPVIPAFTSVSGETLTFTGTAPGTYEFTFILTDNTQGITSAPATGTITVTAAPLVENRIDGISKTYTIKVGESISITSAMLAEGATNSSDGSPVVSLTSAGNILVSADFTSLPVGAVPYAIDPNGNGFTFSSLVPGTYEVKYTLDYLRKDLNPSGEITSYIVVTPKTIKKPTVTG